MTDQLVEVHPRHSIIESMAANGWGTSDLASEAGVDTRHMMDVVDGKAPITSDIARGLEKAFRVPARFWLNMQRNYDVAVKARKGGRFRWVRAHGGWTIVQYYEDGTGFHYIGSEESGSEFDECITDLGDFLDVRPTKGGARVE